mgnify:FL=1
MTKRHDMTGISMTNRQYLTKWQKRVFWLTPLLIKEGGKSNTPLMLNTPPHVKQK